MHIKKMVDRFLGWSLPKDFAPDNGISFKEGAWWPSGTNLLHAGQAEEMFRYCIAEPTNFQERVIAEKAELDGNLERLRAFFPTELCLGLPFAERDRLKRQEQAMTAYSAVLGQRIAAFDCPVPDEPVGAEQGTVPDSDAEIEQQIIANGLTAPRVTPADLTANIADVEFVTHVSKSGQVLRWAVLTTQNGFAVTGRPSVAVSKENDNEEIGRQVAYENARGELWPLMGYALKEKLASA